jgi:small-conductance mechanosensitive channel
MILLLSAPAGPVSPAWAAETVPPAGIGPPQTPTLENLRQRIEAAAETERTSLDAFRQKINQLAAQADDIQARMEELDRQIAAQRNLFLVEQTPISALERAFAENVAAGNQVAAFIDSAEKNLDWASEQIREIRGRSQLYQADFETRLGQWETPDEVPELRARLDEIEKMFAEKLDLLQAARERYGEEIVPPLRELRAQISAMAQRLGERLKERKTTELFKRDESGATFLQEILIFLNPKAMYGRAKAVIDAELASVVRRLETVGNFFLFAFVVLFAALEFAALRIRGACLRLEAGRDLAARWPWGRMALRMFADGLPLAAATLYFYFYAQLRNLWVTLALFRIGFLILGVWLVTRWYFTFLEIREEMAPDGPLQPVRGMLRLLLRIFRWLIPAFVLSIWLMGGSGALQTTGRLFFDLILLGWIARFWDKFQKNYKSDSPGRVSMPFVYRLLKGGSYLVPSVGIVLILLGFFSLSLYWSTSWLLTFPLLLWGGVLLQVLREWRRHFHAERDLPPGGEDRTSARLLQWLLMQLALLTWAALAFPALVFAWYVDKAGFFLRATQLLRAPLPVEGLHISFFSIFSAILVVLLTHAAVRVGKPLVQDRFLADSGMNRGARTSITLIVIYGFWALGILVALNVLGVQSGHLAVVFGALGLGLGFGLQNIFNNFISGIILLFERPIQVGDVVEINGTWAEVRNINVRATQVQTYDNASLLIPNSEFVSSTVTNWSFKDLRIRRNIYVGVAYGSDIELTRDTLLEIAGGAEYVLKYPQPLVYFTDFGDSALIFRLRFWTDVDNCLTAETNIRFAIDRLFRERGIEIAFPQRDIHIRTIAGANFAPTPAGPAETGGESTPLESASAQPAGPKTGTHSDPSPDEESGDEPPSGP